eukprot:scaffold28864_cov62-Phaeocystis_antarctica.AAC.5
MPKKASASSTWWEDGGRWWGDCGERVGGVRQLTEPPTVRPMMFQYSVKPRKAVASASGAE